MDLSIIIPVWNEESKIATDIINIAEHFERSDLKIELIIVDDGSSDRTIEIVQKTFKNFSLAPKIIACPHKGKGHTVCRGMEESQGKFCMFMDCGGNVPLNFINKGTAILMSGKTDILLGTRYHPQSKIIYDMVWSRKITSTVFRIISKTFLGLPKEISDSQCGFKLFKGDLAREIFKNVTTDGFLFDLEVISIARVKNCRLQEFPLEWRCDRDSRLRIFSSLFPVLKGLFQLKKI